MCEASHFDVSAAKAVYDVSIGRDDAILRGRHSAVTCETLLAIYRKRTATQAIPGLYGDPAWIMLLALEAARLRGEHLSAAQVATEAGCSASTGARWIALLLSEGLVEAPAGHDGPLAISPRGSLHIADILSV